MELLKKGLNQIDVDFTSGLSLIEKTKL